MSCVSVSFNETIRRLDRLEKGGGQPSTANEPNMPPEAAVEDAVTGRVFFIDVRPRHEYEAERMFCRLKSNQD